LLVIHSFSLERFNYLHIMDALTPPVSPQGGTVIGGPPLVHLEEKVSAVSENVTVKKKSLCEKTPHFEH
jgi:hypothetical protein